MLIETPWILIRDCSIEPFLLHACGVCELVGCGVAEPTNVSYTWDARIGSSCRLTFVSEARQHLLPAAWGPTDSGTAARGKGGLARAGAAERRKKRMRLSVLVTR
eukprot:7756467-Pyramimonas_sp.AAC.1